MSLLNSVWRPIANLIEDWPLTVCDGSTVDIQEDLLVSDVVQKSYVGETYYALHRDHYRWYYLNRQTENETLLLKIWDNDPTAAAKCTFRLSSAHIKETTMLTWIDRLSSCLLSA